MSLILLLSLATYRITRLIVEDKVWEVWRIKLSARIVRKPTLLRRKLNELLTCPFCMSVWVAAAVVAVADRFLHLPVPVLAWPAVAGGALVAWRYVEE